MKSLTGFLSLHEGECFNGFLKPSRLQPSAVMWLQIWHSGWWLTSPNSHKSQHASVSDSSWRPDLTEVSTTTAVWKELRTSNTAAYVSAHKHSQPISSMRQCPWMRAIKRDKKKERAAVWLSQYGPGYSTHGASRVGPAISCTEVKANPAADAECQGGRQRGSPTATIVWSAARHVCKQNPPFSEATGVPSPGRLQYE